MTAKAATKSRNPLDKIVFVPKSRNPIDKVVKKQESN